MVDSDRMASKTIAIAGAGLAGSLAALELADRGNGVVLYDCADAPLEGASFVNEGKIHLGYVYAADPSGRTARKMLEGAFAFRPAICRWMDRKLFEATVTGPFDYAVPEGSQLPAGRIEEHFAKVTDLIASLSAAGGDYLGFGKLPRYRPLKEHGYGSADQRILAVYSTPERAVDTHRIAEAIRGAVLSHPRIEFRPGQRVEKFSSDGRGWRVHTQTGGDGPYDTVVNAAWHNRRLVDRNSGFADSGSWFLRYKAAVLLPDRFDDLRNFTLMLGSYGDLVRYPSRRVYASWYPTMMLASTREIELAIPVLSAGERNALIETSLRELSRFYPPLERFLGSAEIVSASLTGGHIVARGETDIADRESRLHQRTDIGVFALDDGYFSLESGKYTTTPLFAKQAADAISPPVSVHRSMRV